VGEENKRVKRNCKEKVHKGKEAPEGLLNPGLITKKNVSVGVSAEGWRKKQSGGQKPGGKRRGGFEEIGGFVKKKKSNRGGE